MVTKGPEDITKCEELWLKKWSLIYVEQEHDQGGKKYVDLKDKESTPNQK